MFIWITNNKSRLSKIIDLKLKFFDLLQVFYIIEKLIYKLKLWKKFDGLWYSLGITSIIKKIPLEKGK